MKQQDRNLNIGILLFSVLNIPTVVVPEPKRARRDGNVFCITTDEYYDYLKEKNEAKAKKSGGKQKKRNVTAKKRKQ